MTAEDLDRIAARRGEKCLAAAEFLKSDREVLDAFFELADILRDVKDMRVLLGEENELVQEFALPACRRGMELLHFLAVKADAKRLLPDVSKLVLDCSKRRRKRGKPGKPAGEKPDPGRA